MQTEHPNHRTMTRIVGHKGSGNVLVVDDDPTVVDAIRLVLERMGEYAVTVARSGRECLNKVRTEQPALILLDIHMPEMDGLEVLRQLRSRPECSHIPVLIVSVDARLEKMAACFEAGADGFLIKPFDTLNLYQQVRSTISRYQAAVLQRQSSQ